MWKMIIQNTYWILVEELISSCTIDCLRSLSVINLSKVFCKFLDESSSKATAAMEAEVEEMLETAVSKINGKL